MDKKTQDLMFSSEFPDWETPNDLYKELDEEFNFDIDLAAIAENTKCKNFISPEQDIFRTSWSGIGFLNPPYSQCEWPCKVPHHKCKKKKCKKRGHHISEYIPGQIDFVHRVAVLARENLVTTVCLLPARTDTALFHLYIWDKRKNKPKHNVEVRFLEGRLKFKGAKDVAPFPSMIVIFQKFDSYRTISS